ncbi:MAG: putative molybdenum carrier protein [Gammaproteobacteria bacterium]|nr:putative molybdenum carrier protein [Gammaproteobacteria bacterium]
MIEKIISGGQTGVDRAALDCAIALHIPHGGWCPTGRKAEDGRLDDRYRLVELDSNEYADRTRKNVEDSDGTLVLTREALEGGTALTVTFAENTGRPVMAVDLDNPPQQQEIRNWLTANKIKRCNVAGPRESKQPGIYRQAYAYLYSLLTDPEYSGSE